MTIPLTNRTVQVGWVGSTGVRKLVFWLCRRTHWLRLDEIALVRVLYISSAATINVATRLFVL